jgi:S-adenosylmethionine/arginine decarboxylase-like enzyme
MSKEFRLEGKTLTVDLYGCNAEILQNPGRLYRLLLDLPQEIGMRIIAAPQMARWDAPLCENPEAWGYSGTVLFAESHAYFHTWPEGSFVMFDLTSCGNFDHEFVMDNVQAAFFAKIAVPRVVLRGRGP